MTWDELLKKIDDEIKFWEAEKNKLGVTQYEKGTIDGVYVGLKKSRGLLKLKLKK